jgi:hypothetical protein
VAWPDLFDLTDLPSWLQVPAVDTETAIRVRRFANGWLMNATGLTTWPNPIPDNLWAWAIELAGIAFRNPSAAASEGLDDYSVSYDRARRKEILDAAQIAYQGTSGGIPLYSFPAVDWHWEVVPTVPAIANG